MPKPFTGEEISALFDAIPESIVIRESVGYGERTRLHRVVGGSRQKDFPDWEQLDRRGRDFLEEGAAGRICGEVKIAGSPISLLFGKNGSGKTRFLEAVAELSSGKRSLLGASVKFRFPTDDMVSEWRVCAVSARDSEWMSNLVDLDLPEDVAGTPDDFLISDQLQRIFGRSVVDDVTRSLLRDPSWTGPDQLGLEPRAHLEWFGFSEEVITAWEERDNHRWGPNRPPDDSDSFRPYAFLDTPSARALAPEYYLQYASQVAKIPTEGPHQAYGEVWPSTSDWMNSTPLSGLIGPAVEEFLRRFTHVEYVNHGYFRLLADRDDVPAVMAYLAAAKDFHDEQYRAFFPRSNGPDGSTLNTSLPLDMFRLRDGDAMVESALIKSVTGRHSLLDVLNLTPDDASTMGMEALLAELAGRNLGVSIHPVDGSSDDLRVHVHGYDTLSRVSEKVSKIASRCDCGIDEVRIRGFDPTESGWLRYTAESDTHYKYVGRQVFSAVPPPKIEWKDKNSGDWLEFGEASLGQRQILMVLFSVHLLVESETRSPLTIVVGDEIDKNLHWSASSSLFRELTAWLSGTKGIFVIFSTHTVPALGSPGLSGINRVFSRREGKAFSFLPSRDADEWVVKETLGVSGIDAMRFADLILVVEGDHDELVFRSKFLESDPYRERIHSINGGGLYSWSGILNNSLQHLDAPILFVHDKRNERLEAEWERIRELLEKERPLPRWGETDLAALHAEIHSRSVNRESVSGDDEAKNVLWMLRNDVFEPRASGLKRIQPNATLARRIHLHGLEVDDVVDLLPIDLFPKAKRFSNWADAHDHYPNGQIFKDKLNINHKSIVSALKRDDGHRMNPEIQRLVHRINGLIPASSPLD